MSSTTRRQNAADPAVKFSQPYDIDDVTMAFPAKVAHLMPNYEDIPQQFRDGSGDAKEYVAFQRTWFYSGLKPHQVPAAKPGIDQRKAIRHLGAVQGSYAPKHEHKEAAVAFLASLWLVKPNLEAA